MARLQLLVVLLLILLVRSSVSRAALPIHSHNDYQQARPLELALKHRLASVEADVWSQGRTLAVGHLPLVYRGTLRELYLFPLLDRVFQNRGSVYGDGKTFYLWIEFKDCDPESARILHDELSRYPIFTQFTDEGIRWRPVTVIVTGNEKNKERMAERPGVRLATRDAHWISSSDPVEQAGQWLWYALDWQQLFDWNGKGAISPGERARLRELLTQVRTLGRKLRFFNAPDREEFWALARHEGFDLVGTDRIARAAGYWETPSIRWNEFEDRGQIQYW